MATVQDLLNYVRRRTNDAAFDKDVAVQRNIIEQAMRRLQREYHWSFFRIRQPINLVAPVTTGTVSITNGSASVVGDGTNFVAGDVGKWFQLDGDQVAYQISAVADTENLTLTQQYVNSGGDNVAAADYQILTTDYALTSNVGRIITVINQQMQRELALIPEWQMDVNIRTQNIIGTPLYFCPVTDYAASQKVRIFPAPDRQYPMVVVYDRLADVSNLGTDSATVDWPAKIDVLEAACFYEAAMTPMLPIANKMFPVARAQYYEALAMAMNEDRVAAGPIVLDAGNAGYTYRSISITTTVTPP